MGSLRLSEALTGGKMMTKTSIFAALCIGIVLAVSLNVSGAGLASSDPDRAYCVQMGYLYRETSSLNNGMGICEFPDSTWCDCRAFYEGKCSANLYARHSPNFYNAGQSGQHTAAVNLCQSSGGSVRNIHTPYGDVDVCAFPDGRTVDLWALYGRATGDDWLYYAHSWLSAP
jgi:putative hemolysin